MPRSMKNCVPEPLVPSARSSRVIVASRRPGRSGCRRPTRQPCRPGTAGPCVPRARTLLWPPCTSTLGAPAAASCSSARSSAQPFPIAPGLISTPGRRNRTRHRDSSSCTHCMPEAATASASAASSGVRPCRRRNPQALTIEPAAMSNAPAVRACRSRARCNRSNTSADTSTQPAAAVALIRESSLDSR